MTPSPPSDILFGRSNRQGRITLASYDWIDLQTPEDYDRLVDVLDPEFDPESIAQRLKSQVTGRAKGMLVEHGYVDKDYRSTFYNFYAKKGRQYRADCVRLHFFEDGVSYDEARTDIAHTRRAPTRPLLRLHRTKTDHRRHLGAISALADTFGEARAEGQSSRLTMSTCLVINSPYGGSLPCPSTLT